MKHFEIGYHVGNHLFTYVCTTAYEALEALMSIGAVDRASGIIGKEDEIMALLLDMKNGTLLTHHAYKYTIRYVDGEV